MRLSPNMTTAMEVMMRHPVSAWAIGWGTARALERRGLAMRARWRDYYRLTAEGRRLGKAWGLALDEYPKAMPPKRRRNVHHERTE